MPNYISLKSRLLREGDPWQADISEFKIPLTVDQKLYERDLLNFRRKYAVVEDAPEIAAQDMVTLTCTAESPRFCKEHLTVRVGLGLFSKELENQLIGWKPGQTGTVTVKGRPVNATVEAVRRERLPEVDDALAERCGDPYIRTAEDIHAYCRGKQFDNALEEPLDDAFPSLSRQVLDGSEFELDPEELAYCQEEMVRQFLRSPLLQGRDLDSVPEEEFSGWFGGSKEGLLSQMRQAGTYSLKSVLIGLAMLERAGKTPMEADYDAYLRRFIDRGATEEQARREHPVLDYCLDFAGGYFEDELEALTLHRLKEGYIYQTAKEKLS